MPEHRSDRPALWYGALVVAVLALGVTLRTLGYFDGLEFWSDESAWVMRLKRDVFFGTSRPLGYRLLSAFLIDLRNTEPVVRAPSYVAGLLSLPAFLSMCRWAGLSRSVSLLGLFVLAVHPAAIDMSKEFKPYSLELFLHLAVVSLAFSYVQTSKLWRLVLACAATAIAALLTWSVVMLCPALFLALAIVDLRRRRWARVGIVAGGAAVTMGAFATNFLMVMGGSSAQRTSYWGKKYDVFFTGDGASEQLQWLAEKTYDVGAFPGKLAVFWTDSPALGALGPLQFGLCLLGVVGIVAGRKWTWALLWLLPWGTTLAFSLAERWPYGAFRTNLFLLAYALPLALVGLDSAHRVLSRWFTREARGRSVGSFVVPIFCGIYVIACLPYDVNYFSAKRSFSGNQATRRAMQFVYDSSVAKPSKKKELILLDGHACQNYKYYRDHHADSKREFAKFFRDRFGHKCIGGGLKGEKKTLRRLAKRGYWLIHSKRSTVDDIKSVALKYCRVDVLHDFPEGNLVVRCLAQKKEKGKRRKRAKGRPKSSPATRRAVDR